MATGVVAGGELLREDLEQLRQTPPAQLCWSDQLAARLASSLGGVASASSLENMRSAMQQLGRYQSILASLPALVRGFLKGVCGAEQANCRKHRCWR